ncbi:MAG: hypothetical protein U5L04_07695, partial [Trueperaceae bacterium]|nr:hypothetical protein [Trueperaceae bacterium]
DILDTARAGLGREYSVSSYDPEPGGLKPGDRQGEPRTAPTIELENRRARESTPDTSKGDLVCA